MFEVQIKKTELSQSIDANDKEMRFHEKKPLVQKKPNRSRMGKRGKKRQKHLGRDFLHW